MKRFGIMPGVNTLNAFRGEDNLRLKNAAKKISANYRIKRKSFRFKKRENFLIQLHTKQEVLGLVVSHYWQKRGNLLKTKTANKSISKTNRNSKSGKDPKIVFVVELSIDQFCVHD